LNPKDVILVSSRKSYGDVKAIAFSFAKNHLYIIIFSIYENYMKTLAFVWMIMYDISEKRRQKIKH